MHNPYYVLFHWPLLNNIIVFNTVDFQILEHPKSMACNYLAQVFLSVSVVGPGPLSYNWKKDGVDIVDEEYTGVNEPILSIRYFMLKHEGKYLCEVKHDEKSIESVPAQLELSK